MRWAPMSICPALLFKPITFHDKNIELYHKKLRTISNPKSLKSIMTSNCDIPDFHHFVVFYQDLYVIAEIGLAVGVCPLSISSSLCSLNCTLDPSNRALDCYEPLSKLPSFFLTVLEIHHNLWRIFINLNEQDFYHPRNENEKKRTIEKERK